MGVGEPLLRRQAKEPVTQKLKIISKHSGARAMSSRASALSNPLPSTDTTKPTAEAGFVVSEID
jgi:hypothetical protein